MVGLVVLQDDVCRLLEVARQDGVFLVEAENAIEHQYEDNSKEEDECVGEDETDLCEILVDVVIAQL